MSKKVPTVVVIGGGTGTYTLLSGLRDYSVHLSALMTMVDDGGSNKVLRDEFGLLPTSGIRQAIVALSMNRTLLRELFQYRYHQGEGISGMTFGNLFLAAMADILGSQEKAIEETAKLLQVKGEVVPISYDNVELVASYEDGSEVVGEHHIDEPKHDGTLHIVSVSTKPKATIGKRAKKVISDADMILLGPGDLYTNTLADLVVSGVKEAILQSKAKVVFIENLMTKYGETYNYKASDYLTDLNTYLPISRVDYVVINSDIEFPKAAIEKYKQEHSIPVEDDLDFAHIEDGNFRIVRAPILSREEIQLQKGDTVKRSMIRHDQHKLAKVIIELLLRKKKEKVYETR